MKLTAATATGTQQQITSKTRLRFFTLWNFTEQSLLETYYGLTLIYTTLCKLHHMAQIDWNKHCMNMDTEEPSGGDVQRRLCEVVIASREIRETWRVLASHIRMLGAGISGGWESRGKLANGASHGRCLCVIWRGRTHHVRLRCFIFHWVSNKLQRVSRVTYDQQCSNIKYWV